MSAGGNKAWLDHVAHEQVADPFGILSVCFVALLRLCVLWMSQYHITGFLQNIEHGNPILSG